MSEKVKIRAYLDVTIRVPAEWEEDVDEMREWMEESGKEFTLRPLTVHEFIMSDTSEEWMHNFPNADPNIHKVYSSDLEEVEILRPGNE